LLGKSHRRVNDACRSQVLMCTSSAAYSPSPWTTYSRSNVSSWSGGSYAQLHLGQPGSRVSSSLRYDTGWSTQVGKFASDLVPYVFHRVSSVTFFLSFRPRVVVFRQDVVRYIEAARRAVRLKPCTQMCDDRTPTDGVRIIRMGTDIRVRVTAPRTGYFEVSLPCPSTVCCLVGPPPKRRTGRTTVRGRE
jgi:hypothetical protein